MSKYCFLGDSYAAERLKDAAIRRGLQIAPLYEADCVFVSQDTSTDKNGIRNLEPIKQLIKEAHGWNPIRYANRSVVLTSQVPPGFSRGHSVDFHQAETLRIEDGPQRAMYPEQIIVGQAVHPSSLVGGAYYEYLEAFQCPIVYMTLEEAEFAKIAINYFLAKQVDTTNELAERAALCGANWGRVARALRNDSRIGKYAYLTPGDWKKSIHLLRDYVTLNEMKPL